MLPCKIRRFDSYEPDEYRVDVENKGQHLGKKNTHTQTPNRLISRSFSALNYPS